LDQRKWRLEVFCQREEFRSVRALEATHLRVDGAKVTNRLDHVARPGFSLGADEARTLSDSSKRFTQVGRAAHKRDR
jgi:hypothetical protein